MENLAPSLILLWDVQRAVESGQSVNQGIKTFLNRRKVDVFQYQIDTWWHSQRNPNIVFDKRQLRAHRRMLLELLEAGVRGQSVAAGLKNIEAELILSCEEEISRHVANLPLLLLFPLLGLVFPAMLMLLILPILKMLHF